MKGMYFHRRGMSLVPANEETVKRLSKVKEGALALCEVVFPRNPQFHDKFFSMLRFAYDYWEPEEEMIGGLKAEKTFERFRRDAIILAGFRHPVVNIKGEVRFEADSIKFGKMEAEKFEELYKSVFNVVWVYVLSKVQGMTPDEAHNAINELLSYDS